MERNRWAGRGGLNNIDNGPEGGREQRDREQAGDVAAIERAA
jgi:hypothetical protein